MKERKKTLKGFTLVELLATIAIISLIAVGAIFTINKVHKSSIEKSTKITINSILTSANTYTVEYKKEEKYWFTETTGSNSNLEYSCVSIGSLIDKGYLKESIIDTKINDETISRDTKLKISRNKVTKTVINKTIADSTSSDECSEDLNLDFTFEVEGTKGNINNNIQWYTGDVTVKAIPKGNLLEYNESKVIINENDKTDEFIENINGDSKEITVSHENRDINVCINVKDLKENERTFCLGETKSLLFIDKTSPELSMELNNTGEIETDAEDNLTENSKLVYKLNDNIINDKIQKIQNPDEYNDGKDIKLTVSDEAGNTATLIKTLTINNPNSKSIDTLDKYYCSLDTTVVYETETAAKEACIETGQVTSSTNYACSSNNNVYSTYTDAYNNCYTQNNGTITSQYYCNNKPSNSSNCLLVTDTFDGYCLYNYVCRGASSYVNGMTLYPECPSGTTSSYKLNYGPAPAQINNRCIESMMGSCTIYCSVSTNAILKYYCNSTGSFVDDLYSPCYSRVLGTVTSNNSYICSLTGVSYDNETDGNAACKKAGEISSSQEYTCDINNETYTDYTIASEKCTNYCATGNNYNNKCYSLEEK